MRTFRAAVAASLLLLWFIPVLPSAGQAQNAPKSARVASVTITGTKKYQADQVATAGKIETGDVVTVEQIQAASDRLAALGIFSKVNYRFAAKGDAIALEFQVEEAPTFPVLFDNFPWFTDTELGDDVRAEVGLFPGESPESGTMLDEITTVLESLLASKNIKGSVTHQLLANAEGDGMTMQFRVEGTPLRVLTVHFGDPLATESERLKDRIPDIKGQPYSRFALDLFQIEQVRPLYLSKGYLRAKIGPPEAHVAADPDRAGASGVEITIPIVPGPVYTWKGVAWHGNSAYTSVNLDIAVELKPGDPADAMKIENDWRTIEHEYGRRGYLDVTLNAQPEYDDANHQVFYQVEISEGSPYKMGQLIITGLSVEAEKRLRHYWQIPAGQDFNNGYFEGLVKELRKPSVDVFGELPLHYSEFGHWLRQNPDQHTVDVLMDFK